MSGIKVQTLKRRALEFLKDAKRDLQEGSYDLSVFYAEQALQLYLKAILFELFATEIKSHNVRGLLSTLSKLFKENGYSTFANEIENISKEYRDKLIDLEDAYIDSRYEDVNYDKEVAEDLVNFVEIIINKLEEMSKNVKLGEG